jgi:hypothetical protein
MKAHWSNKFIRWGNKCFCSLLTWISAYRFSDKVYNFLVNGITGEVKGERPWSVLKIVLFIASVIGGIAGLVYLYQLFS